MVGASICGFAKTLSSEGWRDLGTAGHSELELTAMAGTVGAAVHSHVTVR